MPDDSILPQHVEETVAAIAKLHAAHYSEAAPVQRIVGWATGSIARPRTLGVFLVAVLGWLALNLWLEAATGRAPDPYPFSLLSMTVSTLSLFLTTMVLIAQRHDDRLATQREQLTLELAILAEQKSAKIIALLEEFRHNDPNQSNRRDKVAEALAEPADPQAVLGAIRASQDRPPSADDNGDDGQG